MALPRGTEQQWRKLRAQVLKEEPTCRIRLPGCTHTATTADHIIPASQRPDLYLVRSNIRGACSQCNSRLGGAITLQRKQAHQAAIQTQITEAINELRLCQQRNQPPAPFTIGRLEAALHGLANFEHFRPRGKRTNV